MKNYIMTGLYMGVGYGFLLGVVKAFSVTPAEAILIVCSYIFFVPIITVPASIIAGLILTLQENQ
jgi:hypothetical protein